MIIAILICVLAVLVYTDIKALKIPNLIIFPAILGGCLITGFWIQMLTAFFLLAFLTEEGKVLRWSGGDVKLFAMIASFVGWLFIPISLVTEMAVKIYMISLNNRMSLPMAPFACLATVFVITAVAVFRIVWNMVA